MKKGIKRIISICLAITAFSVLEPVKYSNIMTEIAYADDDIYLKGISVTDGDDIILNSSKKTYSTGVPNSSEEVIIRVTTNDKNDIVTIDGGTPEKPNDRKYQETVSLDKGVNTFEIVVKSQDGDKEREYTLKIDRGAKESTDSDSVFLDNIDVDYGSIDFLKTTTSYDLKVDEDVAKLRVKAEPENDNYIVRIDGVKVTEDDKYRREVSLLKGENTIIIDAEDEEDDANTKTYTLNVYRGKDTSKTDEASNTNLKFDDKQDPIYLDDIVLEDGYVKLIPNFNKRITSYGVDVPEDKEDIIVKAEPEYGSNIVKINGVTLKDTNRKRIALTEGKNVIEIQVNTDSDQDDDDYEKRVYTLKVFRGTSEGTATSEMTNVKDSGDKNSSGGKVNQWMNVNGKWKYYDFAGSALKSTWYYDKTYGKNYYFDADGNMVTGWLSNNGAWYYLDQNGAKVTGWKQLGVNWYYLDNEGKMKTGWFKDTNGKWYYLYYSSGIMAASTTIDGYKLRADGAMIS